MNNALKLQLEKRAQPGDIFSLLIKGNVSKLKEFQNNDYTVNYSQGDIASVTCNRNALAFMLDHKLITYAELSEPRNRVMNDTMLVKNRIKPVKLGVSPLARGYDGSGVIIGIIDTGLDFNHGDFKDAQGNSRIRFLWDQAATAGSAAPAPYNYGVEWTDGQIDAGQCTHDDLGHYGHGTHVTGITAGNGLANGRYEGCAPKADIIAVALDFSVSGPTIADAIHYIFSKATALHKPCVINVSLGDYYGSHDGTNLEAKVIDNMVKNIPGRVIVSAAGNAGNIKYHVKTQPLNGDTLFTWLNNGSHSEDYWCYADTNDIKNIKFSIGANRSNFSNIGTIGFKNYNYALGAVQKDTIKNNGNILGVIKTSASINAYGVYELYVHADSDTASLNWRIETCGAGLHHAWNFDFVSSGLPPAQNPLMAYYAIPDTLYSLVSSFQCSDEIITVGNYVNMSRYYDVNNNLQNTNEITGDIAANSSVGPTRDGRQKPDITASGNNIFAAYPIGMQNNLITNLPQAVAQGSFHAIDGGTSSSSPVVAGLAALYLQRFPHSTNQTVKNAITFCAFRDGYTGNQFPDYTWGFGKLDGKAAMTCFDVPNSVGLTEIKNGATGISYFPNPFTSTSSIRFDKKTEASIYVYTADGRLILQDVFAADHYDLQASALNTVAGMLFVNIISSDVNVSFKLIKN